MISFLGFAYKFVVSSFFKKNDACGCGFIKPNGIACGMTAITSSEGVFLPTCHQHAILYHEATEVVLLELSGDNLRGMFHWEVVEKAPGMVHFFS